MGIFASHTRSEPIPIPFDPPHTVTVRTLTARELDAAQEAHRGNLASGSPRSWATTFRRMLEKGASDPEVLQAIADPLTGYDRFALVRGGLVAWTYPQAIKTSPVTAAMAAADAAPAIDAIDDLIDEAVDFIATEVLRLTKPHLFHATEADAKVAQKNG